MTRPPAQATPAQATPAQATSAQATPQGAPPSAPSGPGMPPARTLTQQLAACGFSVHSYLWGDRQELIICNIPAARSCLTLTNGGHACWHYEPRGGPPSAAMLAAIIMHILGAPSPTGNTPGADAYQAFPLKGTVGRCLQDRGLTVTLRISEDLESFEATTGIQVTSPARPWLGEVHLADNGDLDWECDYRAAFHNDPAHLAATIVPVLRGQCAGLRRTGYGEASVTGPGEPGLQAR